MQILVVAVGVGLLVAYLLLGSLLKKAEAPASAAATAPSDSFKPTDAQWAGLKTASVQVMAFSASQVTEGKHRDR